MLCSKRQGNANDFQFESESSIFSFKMESYSGTRDYSSPITFNIDHEKPDKTIDVGFHGTAVSSDPLGSVRRD